MLKLTVMLPFQMYFIKLCILQNISNTYRICYFKYFINHFNHKERHLLLATPIMLERMLGTTKPQFVVYLQCG